MKALFSKPKLIIPIAAVVALVVGIILYGNIGIAPTVGSIPQQSPTDTPIATGSTVDLSFPKSGRIDAVMVTPGASVHRGDVLARLAAPDAAGAVQQAKGAVDLARAQLASLNTQYATATQQQDRLVQNAFRTLLSSGLAGVPDRQTPNQLLVSGTYTCDREGSYVLKPYASGDSDSGYSIQFSGLESGVVGVKYDNPVALGACGLQVQFVTNGNFDPTVIWTIDIPNTISGSYLANKNAYDLAVTTREKTLNDLAASIGTGATGSGVAQAQIVAAEGAYAAAVGAYQNNLITAPVDGVVQFVDTDLKVGQAVVANKTVISLIAH